MTQAEKYVAAAPILKAAVLAGKDMTEAAKMAGVSRNTANAYRKRAEKAEGRGWLDELDGSLATTADPMIEGLAQIIRRRIAWTASQPVAADQVVAHSQALGNLGAVHDKLIERIERAQDRANDRDSVIRGLEGFKQYLCRELEAGRLPEATMETFRALYARYVDDLANGRFEVQPT